MYWGGMNMIIKGRRAGTSYQYLVSGGAAAGFLGALCLCMSLAETSRADVILQIFESRYLNIDHCMPDIFMAG
jgi:hypothetical protein